MKNTVATAKAITRFICLMLVLILCSFCAVGCQRNITDEPAVIVPSSDPSADKNDDAQNVTPKAEILSLIDNGAAKVRVVYSNKDSDMAIGAAKSLAASLTKLGGVDVYAVVDFSTDKKADSPCIVLHTAYCRIPTGPAAVSVTSPPMPSEALTVPSFWPKWNRSWTSGHSLKKEICSRSWTG